MNIRPLISAVAVASFCIFNPAIALADDDRNKIVLSPKERTLMLEDMRNYLNGIREISLAIAKENPAAIEQAARRMGKIAIYEVKPMMSASLIPKFRRLGEDLHHRFDALADSAAAGRPPLKLLGDLSLLINQCVKCHETYQITDTSH